MCNVEVNLFFTMQSKKLCDKLGVINTSKLRNKCLGMDLSSSVLAFFIVYGRRRSTELLNTVVA